MSPDVSVVMPVYNEAHVIANVVAELKEQGISTTFHYVPLHDSEGGRRFARRPTECPVTIDVSTRLVRLPFYNTLPPAEVERVSEAFVAAVERAS